ncbi:MAG: M48 family metallopeptidase, partial [Pseudomonadota bacterium]
FTYLFVVLLGLMLLTQWWLSSRHIRFVADHRARVPSAFRRRIPLKAHRRAADYTVAKARFARVDAFVGVLLLLGWTLGGWLASLDQFWRGWEWGPLATGTVVILSAWLLMTALELPASIYQTFVIEARFGFNRMRPGVFIVDQMKSALLLLILGAPLVFVVLWLMQSMGSTWWLYVWVLWVAFSLFMVWAYPTLIAPLFNRFKPLKSGRMRARIQALLRRTGFRSKGIFVIDSSRRTAHGNAYFTGLGRGKRIVFFDTLLKSLNGGEIEAVLAHELGHFKLRHVLKRMALMMVMSFVALALLGWLIEQSWFYAGLGMPEPSTYAALILFILVGPVFTFFTQPLFAWGSRKHEFEADAFAADETSARNLVSALVKLYKDNAATLTPDPLHSAFYDSHPPAVVRIAHLLGKT